MRCLCGADDGEDGQGERGRGRRSSSKCALAIDLHFFTLCSGLPAPSQVIKARREPRETSVSCVGEKDAPELRTSVCQREGRGRTVFFACLFLSASIKKLMATSAVLAHSQTFFLPPTTTTRRRAKSVFDSKNAPVSPTFAGHRISLSLPREDVQPTGSCDGRCGRAQCVKYACGKGAKREARETIDRRSISSLKRRIRKPRKLSSSCSQQHQPSMLTPRSPP